MFRLASLHSRKTLGVTRKSSFNSFRTISSEKKFNDKLTFFLNGKKTELSGKDIQPDEPLINYIRTGANLTGTKLTCGEGGCGACTVTISHYDQSTKKVVNRAVNSCLVPVCYVNGMEVTTVEGIGSVHKELHPVQERMSIWGGSQCGFCTPGFVMSMYTSLKNNPNPEIESFRKSMDGNLCRCTGYRPIVDVAKSFCSDTKDSVKPPENREFAKYDPSKDPQFPEELKSTDAFTTPFKIGNDRAVWYAPSTLSQLLQLRAEHPTSSIISGSTELGIEFRFKGVSFPVLISPMNIAELSKIEFNEEGMTIGSSVTLERLSNELHHYKEKLPKDKKHRSMTIDALLDQLHWFAGTQIRNVATIGGNIVNASPISDLNPVFLATNSKFIAASTTKSPFEIAAKDFWVGYKKVKLEPSEILLRVQIPWNEKNEYVEAYKQSRRREDDIAIVTSGMSVKLDSQNKIASLRLGFGGMAPTAILAPKTEKELLGLPFTLETFEKGITLLQKEVGLSGERVPGGQAEFRTSLALSFFYKFFVSVLSKVNAKAVDPRDLSATMKSYPPVTPTGTQSFDVDVRGTSVGMSEPHLSAKKHTTGEARYVDDIPKQSNELIAQMVLSKRGHAKILSVDTSEALKIKGVAGVYTAKDIPGKNIWGDVIADEEILASKEVLHFGQPIAVVLAENELIAKEAVKAVKVEYEDLPAIYSIEEAIKKDSFFPVNHGIHHGDVDKAMKESEHVIEGELKMGGQEQFYFETNGTLSVPDEEDFFIYTSSQNAHKTQKFVATCLGIPSNQVVTKVPRLGGGFGGKETRNVNFSAIAALGSYHTKRPVRLMLERDVDMTVTGGRHPFISQYKVGFNSDGKINAVDLALFSNGGISHDLSIAVLDRALLFCDSSYHIPNLKNVGRITRTNVASNTAFRGFGGPQGHLAAEAYVEHVASFLKLPVETVRERNLYNEGERTYYGFPVTKNVKRSWEECKRTSQFEERVRSIEKFNSENRYRKRGITMMPAKYGVAFNAQFLNQGAALLHVYLDGTVLVSHGGVEMGQGLNTKVAQIVASELGIHVSHVRIKEMATDKIPNASPSAASMSTDIYGAAALEAARTIKERLEPYKKANPKATFAELAVKAYFDRVSLSSQGFFKSPHKGYDMVTNKGDPWRYFTLGTACTEVEIDCLTGDHKVLRTDLVLDIGESINPTIDIGQIEGAFMQGSGWVSIEELVWGDEEHQWVKPAGRLQTAGPGTYKIPSADDIPVDWRVSLLKAPIDTSKETLPVMSSKAVGEPPLLLGLSTYFAIKEAVRSYRKQEGLEGFFPVNSPFTSERIRMACADRFTRLAAGEDNESFVSKGSF